MAKNNTEDKLEEPKLITCKNCETEFFGKYCPNCGQSIYEYDKPISFLIVDLLGNIIAFDTRFWKSFIALTFRPGRFALEYLKGHRARYAPPFRIYLFISLAFFLLLSSYIDKSINVADDYKAEFNKAIDREIAADSLALDSLPESDINIQLSGGGIEQEDLGMALKKIIDNPRIYVNSFIRVFSWSLFFLMPVYAAILWLMFKKSKPFYFGHLVFSVNQHALIFLLFSILLIIKLIFFEKEHSYENYLAPYIPVYLFMGTLKLYGNSPIKTFFKLLAGWLLYFLILAFSMGIVIVIWYWLEFL